MNFAKKLILLTIVIIAIVSYSLYYLLTKYDYKFTSSKTNQTSADLHNGPQPSVDNEFAGIYYLLTLTLAIILECSQCKLIEYEVRKIVFSDSPEEKQRKKPKSRSSSLTQDLLDATIKFSKSQNFQIVKQSSLSLVNNFCGLLLMLLLCYSVKLVLWAALGKSFGYFLFKMPVKKIQDDYLNSEEDESFMGRSQEVQNETSITTST